MYWDTQIESEIQTPIFNMLGFIITPPSYEQFVEILRLTHEDGEYNSCDFLDFDQNDYTTFTNVSGGNKTSTKQIYILTHPKIFSIINGAYYYHTLGFYVLNFLNKKKYTYKTNTYILMYIEARCSFGRWPLFKNKLNSLNQKINIGQVMAIYIDSMGRKFAYERGANRCVIFNMSLTKAVEYHLSNGWKLHANLFLNKLKNNKISALQNVINLGIYPENTIYESDELALMYKIVKP